MFEPDQFLADLETFFGFKTVVCRNPEESRLDSSSLGTYYRLCYETARMKVESQ